MKILDSSSLSIWQCGDKNNESSWCFLSFLPFWSSQEEELKCSVISVVAHTQTIEWKTEWDKLSNYYSNGQVKYNINRLKV